MKVTIDGRLNANGIAVRAAGSTADQIRGSMAGGANLGGHIFVGADKALQILGGAATGVAGGVIDNTWATPWARSANRAASASATFSIPHLAGAESLVNHDSPISGHVDIAGGVLDRQGLAVHGNRATANIDTRDQPG